MFSNHDTKLERVPGLPKTELPKDAREIVEQAIEQPRQSLALVEAYIGAETAVRAVTDPEEEAQDEAA